MKYFLSFQLKDPYEENITKLRAADQGRRKQGIGLSASAERGELTWVLPFHFGLIEQKMIGVIDVDDPNIVLKWLMDHRPHATVHATQLVERKAFVEKYGPF